MEQVLPEELKYWTGISLYTDFFPDDLYSKLVEHADLQQERKVTFEVQQGEEFPPPLEEARAYVDEELDIGINIATSKIYREGEPSEALENHYDPEELAGGLFLATLGGVAVVSVHDLHVGLIDFKCLPNTALVLPTRKWHKVRNLKLPRTLLFMSHKCPVIASGEVDMEKYYGLHGGRTPLMKPKGR